MVFHDVFKALALFWPYKPRDFYSHVFVLLLLPIFFCVLLGLLLTLVVLSGASLLYLAACYFEFFDYKVLHIINCSHFIKFDLKGRQMFLIFLLVFN